MPGCWGVNTTATVVIHWTTQHSWSICELPYTGRPQFPLFLSVPTPSRQGPPPSLQRTIISYSDIWRWTLNARKEVFQIGLRNQILLLQQDTVKKTRGKFMSAERMKSINRKILWRKAKHPQNAAQLRVFTEKMLEGQGCGGRLTYTSETVHCPPCHRALTSPLGNWEMLAFSFIISFLS